MIIISRRVNYKEADIRNNFANFRISTAYSQNGVNN